MGILQDAQEWLKPVKDRQDPQTKMIRALTEEVQRLHKVVEAHARSTE